MNPLEFVFELISKYVPVSTGRLLGIKKQAEEWYTSPGVEQNKVANWVKTKGEEWYVQLGLCVLFIFAMRWVNDFMSGTHEKTDEKV